MILGCLGLCRLGIDLFPNVSFPVVAATTAYPGRRCVAWQTRGCVPHAYAMGMDGGRRVQERCFRPLSGRPGHPFRNLSRCLVPGVPSGPRITEFCARQGMAQALLSQVASHALREASRHPSGR
jgi:hypothetical protein